MNQLIHVVTEVVKKPYLLKSGRWEVIVNVDCYGGIRERRFTAKSERDISIYRVGYSFWE